MSASNLGHSLRPEIRVSFLRSFAHCTDGAVNRHRPSPDCREPSPLCCASAPQRPRPQSHRNEIFITRSRAASRRFASGASAEPPRQPLKAARWSADAEPRSLNLSMGSGRRLNEAPQGGNDRTHLAILYLMVSAPLGGPLAVLISLFRNMGRFGLELSADPRAFGPTSSPAIRQIQHDQMLENPARSPQICTSAGLSQALRHQRKCDNGGLHLGIFPITLVSGPTE
jgi:hypothetical protein